MGSPSCAARGVSPEPMVAPPGLLPRVVTRSYNYQTIKKRRKVMLARFYTNVWEFVLRKCESRKLQINNKDSFM